MNNRHLQRSALLACGLLFALMAVPCVLGGLLLRERRQEQLDQQLIAAVKTKNTPVALRLLQRGAEADARDPLLPQDNFFNRVQRLGLRWKTPAALPQRKDGASALQLAVERDLAPVIEALLQHQARDVNAQAKVTSSEGQEAEGSLVAMVLRNSHPDLAWLLWQHGAALSQADREALLCAAATAKNTDLVRRLLARGIDANGGASYDAVDFPTQASPLFRCVQNCDLATARLLLEHGAQTDVYISSYESLMQTAAANGDAAMIRLLLLHGAKADESVRMGTPLCFAAENDHLDVVKMLVAAGADVNFNGYGGSVLSHAGTPGVAAYLLQQGASIEGRIRRGITPLIGAASGGNVALVETYLAYGADVNATNSFGDSALVEACNAEEASSLAVVRVLLEHGAHIRYTAYRTWHVFDDDKPPRVKVDLQQALKRGTALTLEDREETAPLTTAQRQKRSEILALLRHYGK